MNRLNKCLEEEAFAILNASKNLDEREVNKALQLLKQCSNLKSKLVITGVGKSGIVARKIAATFSSIGLMSLFLNPLDALHGDLGVVANDDICLILSNSGETEELLEVIPHLKKRGTKTIAIVGQINSSIARISDVILNACINKEVCPLNLAPTASTAVSMAIGDALAAVWMEEVGISPEDFAINHPAGKLGKQLTMTAKDIMRPLSKVSGLDFNASLSEIILSLTNGSIGSSWVEDNDNPGKLIGLITDGDLRRSLQSKGPKDWIKLKAKDIMTKDPITIDQKTLVSKALKKMERNSKKSISVLPVLDDKNNIIGLLRLHDVIQAGLK